MFIQSPEFGRSLRILKPVYPLCNLLLGGDEISIFSIKSPDFSGFSCYFTLKKQTELTVSKVKSQRQLIGTNLLKMTRSTS